MSFVRVLVSLSCCAVLVASAVGAEKKGEVPPYYGPQPTVESIDLNMYARIREEGFKHSHVMQFAAGVDVRGLGRG